MVMLLFPVNCNMLLPVNSEESRSGIVPFRAIGYNNLINHIKMLRKK